jgi:hypothetical protein
MLRGLSGKVEGRGWGVVSKQLFVATAGFAFWSRRMNVEGNFRLPPVGAINTRSAPKSKFPGSSQRVDSVARGRPGILSTLVEFHCNYSSGTASAYACTLKRVELVMSLRDLGAMSHVRVQGTGRPGTEKRNCLYSHSTRTAKQSSIGIHSISTVAGIEAKGRSVENRG